MAEKSARQMAVEIASSPEVQQFLGELANQIAEDATQAADGLIGAEHDDAPWFRTDVSIMSGDGARAHVWAANGPAIHAERKAQVLVKAAGKHGKGHGK